MLNVAIKNSVQVAARISFDAFECARDHFKTSLANGAFDGIYYYLEVQNYNSEIGDAAPRWCFSRIAKDLCS